MEKVVKRKGHEEAYDERKLYASCYAACINAHHKKEQAEEMCELAIREVNKWGESHSSKSITSNELFSIMTAKLKDINKEASFMYNTYRDIS